MAVIAASAQVTNGPAGVVKDIVFWLDASDVNNSAGTNPPDSTQLPLWKDRSGNGYHARVLAGQDTPRLRSARINGKDAVQFLRSSSTRGTVWISARIPCLMPASSPFKQASRYILRSQISVAGCYRSAVRRPQ